jgi:hypothetical protein
MKKKPEVEKQERICGQSQTLSEFETLDAISDIRREHIFNTMQEIGNELIAEITTPKFTVRGEHNVWHVYRNEERLEPPFRNEQRANTEREHYERSHAIRNERK